MSQVILEKIAYLRFKRNAKRNGFRETYGDRGRPHDLPLPHHRTYGFQCVVEGRGIVQRENEVSEEANLYSSYAGTKDLWCYPRLHGKEKQAQALFALLMQCAWETLAQFSRNHEPERAFDPERLDVARERFKSENRRGHIVPVVSQRRYIWTS